MYHYKYPVFTALHRKSRQLRLYISLSPGSMPSEPLQCTTYHPKFGDGRWTVEIQENVQSYYDCSIRELGWFSDPDLFEKIVEGDLMEGHLASIWDTFRSRKTQSISPIPHEKVFGNWISKLLDTLDLQYGKVYSNRLLELTPENPEEQVLRS